MVAPVVFPIRIQGWFPQILAQKKFPGGEALYKRAGAENSSRGSKRGGKMSVQ